MGDLSDWGEIAVWTFLVGVLIAWVVWSNSLLPIRNAVYTEWESCVKHDYGMTPFEYYGTHNHVYPQCPKYGK